MVWAASEELGCGMVYYKVSLLQLVRMSKRLLVHKFNCAHVHMPNYVYAK